MHPLHRLLLDNRATPRRFEVQANADVATVYLYDVIVSDAGSAEFYGGIAPEPFIQALRAITAPVIHLRINSPGGDVFAARAIEQAMREHGSKIIAHVDGYAASAATLVALAADEVEMAPGAFFMIHNSWSMAFGNSQDMLDMASLLEKVDGTIAATYEARTGQPQEQIRDWMNGETWFTADDAVIAGFAQRIAEPAGAQASWNLGAYAKAPAPRLTTPTPTPKVAPEAKPSTPITDHLLRQLRAPRLA